jgi:hypothetical protein
LAAAETSENPHKIEFLSLISISREIVGRSLWPVRVDFSKSAGWRESRALGNVFAKRVYKT